MIISVAAVHYMPQRAWTEDAGKSKDEYTGKAQVRY